MTHEEKIEFLDRKWHSAEQTVELAIAKITR